MHSLGFPRPGQKVSVLCLGAHSDDIEIGAGGTLIGWISKGVHLDVHWCVLSAPGSRAIEARSSASAFLDGAASAEIELSQFRDGFFPYQGTEIKLWMERLKPRVHPDVIFTHRRDDAHQDHREISRLTWNTFRDHLILEYEIPKWDGDIGQPNLYVPLTAVSLERKIDILASRFTSQRIKDWFDDEVFRGLARLRGMECRAPDRYAEAFVLRKASLG
jgi:LmbE family N-acetylglucosaminyl deacetylase